MYKIFLLTGIIVLQYIFSISFMIIITFIAVSLQSFVIHYWNVFFIITVITIPKL